MHKILKQMYVETLTHTNDNTPIRKITHTSNYLRKHNPLDLLLPTKIFRISRHCPLYFTIYLNLFYGKRIMFTCASTIIHKHDPPPPPHTHTHTHTHTDTQIHILVGQVGFHQLVGHVGCRTGDTAPVILFFPIHLELREDYMHTISHNATA